MEKSERRYNFGETTTARKRDGSAVEGAKDWAPGERESDTPDVEAVGLRTHSHSFAPSSRLVVSG